MLYLCIPTYNEAPTIGVLLWRIRKVFQEHTREYEILVYDDGSTDATAETLAPYPRVLPLTVIRGEERRGYAHAVDALCRAVAKRTRYPRRDAMILLQADFTDQPEELPELIKRFEGGADVVIGERQRGDDGPVPVRRLQRVAPWVLRAFVTVPGVQDPFGTCRLFRISVLRDAIRAAGSSPVASGEGWAANVELLLRTAPHARRLETVALTPRYDLRPRETRVRAFADAMSLYRFGRTARQLRARGAEAAAAGAARAPAGASAAEAPGTVTAGAATTATEAAPAPAAR